MTHNISDRYEYTDEEYAEIRMTEIQAILENGNLPSDDETKLMSELAELRKVGNPIIKPEKPIQKGYSDYHGNTKSAFFR